MDRIDAMKVFIAALDEGSLAGAGRPVAGDCQQGHRVPGGAGRSLPTPPHHTGDKVERDRRTLCRRVLVNLQEAEMVASGEQAAPQGGRSGFNKRHS
jgi:hypothetical protein